MITIGIIVAALICLLTIFSHRSSNTRYEYKEVFVLKNEMTPEWAGGTKKPFNLLNKKAKKEFFGDKVYILKTTKIVFGKVVNEKYTIEQSIMDDEDYGMY